MGNVPGRLLLAFVWFSYVVAAAYVTGLFRPVIVFPAAAVVIALTWRFTGTRDSRAPEGEGRERARAVGSLLAVVLAGIWFLLNLPYLSERVQVNRDPDIYTLAALWLRNHTSPSIPVDHLSNYTAGFGIAHDALGPQGLHLVSGVSASAGWIFGLTAVFWGNLACGAIALLGLYVLGRRVLGPFWALLPPAGLACSLPMLAFSRALYSEPLAMAFTFLGAALLWRAWQRDRISGYLLAGAAFGAVGLARIDGTLPLIGVLIGLTVAAFLHPGRNESRRRWAAPMVLLGSLPGLLLGLADGLLHSGRYVSDLSEQIELLWAALAVAAVIGIAGALVRLRAGALAGVGRGLRVTVIAGAVLAAAGFLVLLSRPWWYVGHTGPMGLVGAAQKHEGLPVDVTRSYAEATFQWISWYYGWPVVLLGLAGLVAWLVLGARGRTQLVWLAALFLPSALLYLTTPSITPDQIWAMRRFIPVVVPGMLLGTAWVARTLVERGRIRAGAGRVVGMVLATAVAVSTVGLPLIAVGPMWSEKDYAGSLAGEQAMCGVIDHRPAIVTGVGPYLPTVLALCNVPAIGLREPTPALIAQARKDLGGGDVVLVTHAPSTVTWDGGRPPQLLWHQTVWESSVDGPPDEVVTTLKGVFLGLVQPDGTVEPVAP